MTFLKIIKTGENSHILWTVLPQYSLEFILFLCNVSCFKETVTGLSTLQRPKIVSPLKENQKVTFPELIS